MDYAGETHFAPNVLYIFGTFGTIETNETFEDKLEQLKATCLVKPGKGLAQAMHAK